MEIQGDEVATAVKRRMGRPAAKARIHEAMRGGGSMSGADVVYSFGWSRWAPMEVRVGRAYLRAQ